MNQGVGKLDGGKPLADYLHGDDVAVLNTPDRRHAEHRPGKADSITRTCRAGAPRSGSGALQSCAGGFPR